MSNAIINNKQFKFEDIYMPGKTIKVSSVEQSMQLILHTCKNRFKNNEISFAVILDNNNFLLELIFDSEGNQNSTMFHYKQIAMRANKIGGKKVVIAHTHPHTSIIASEKDIASVKLIKSYFSEWGIKLLDSCVLDANNKFYSMTAKKIIDMKEKDLSKIRLKSIYNKNIVLKLLSRDKIIENLITEFKFSHEVNSEDYISI